MSSSLYAKLIESLSNSSQPSISYKTRLRVLQYDPASAEMRLIQQQIACSQVVTQLLSERLCDGTLPRHAYQKWRGAHWVLAQLVELEYPPGDESLSPLQEQAFDWYFENKKKYEPKILIQGRYRRCASQPGNILYYSLKLGLLDPRLETIASDLLRYQWQDGGWNCDRKPSASHSSFVETWIPIRALALYNQTIHSTEIDSRVDRACEHLLERSLFLRKSTGEVIDPDYLQLTYPDFYIYTILSGLKAIQQAGFEYEPRCSLALDLLESKFIPDQGWRLEKKYYHHNLDNINRCSPVRWEDTRFGKGNQFLSVEILSILQNAGRLQVK